MDDKWLEQLKQGKCLSERDVKILCEKVINFIFFLNLLKLTKNFMNLFIF